MKPTIAEAAKHLEQRGELIRTRADQSARIIEHVREQVGRDLPPDLEAFYRERIARVGDFLAIAPVWNDRVGWRPAWVETTILLPARAVPIFSDGCGSYYGVDLEAGDASPAVYFFDHQDNFSRPLWAAGSSLATFLLLLADGDRAFFEKWPAKWELGIDPDLEHCPRAPAIWNAS
jgi:hypothetical protein